MIEKVRKQNIQTQIVTRQQTQKLKNRFNRPDAPENEQGEASASELHPPDFSVWCTVKDNNKNLSNRRREPKKYEIDLNVDWGKCDETHETADDGQVLHCVRWYGLEPCDDTCEPINHLPLQKMWIYDCRRRLIPPAYIDKAMRGWLSAF